MTPAPTCPECGSALPPGARRGLCPRCLLKSAFEPAATDETIHLVLADGHTEPLPFREIGDYELIEQIGHGGMGIIFKARQRSLDRLVALKLVRAGSLARPEDLARFRTEAAAAARLKHPHIVAIYEIGEHEGAPFYSMEFVAGRSLADALHDGPFSPKRAAELIREVADAIHFAHEHDVLHRDLKPSNILIDASGKPRIADFGLAKLIHHDSELTLSGAVIGSPDYMPPEQARGRSDQANVRSDVYSLGAVLYEMLTGRPPFAAATALETMKLVVEQEPMPPRALNPLLPRDLETICLKCLAKEPAARYRSARELAEELGRFLQDEPIHARPAGIVERALRWCRRKPALAALAVVLVLTPAIIISVLLVMGSQVAHQRNRAIAQERSTAQNLYAVDIALAFKALDENDFNLAWRSLAAHLPTHPGAGGSNDLRGFEWRWLWERAQGGAAKTFSEHFGEIHAVAWSSDGRYLASASSDGNTRIWDATKLTCFKTLERPGIPPVEQRRNAVTSLGMVTPYMVNSVSFSQDGRQVMTGVAAGIDLWDMASNRRALSISTNGQNMALFSPVDSSLALTYRLYPRDSMGLLDVQKGRMINLFTNGRADAVCFTPDGREFARWDRDTHRISLQTIPDGQSVGSLDTTGIYVASMAFTPDGKILATGNLKNGHVELFDVASRKPCGVLLGRTGRTVAVAISPDGKLLASGGYDQTVRLWDLATRSEIRQMHGHRAAVSALAFSPDGKRLASGGYDGTVRLWDVNPLPPFPAITNVSGAFAFSTDGRWLVTQGTNGTARIWESSTRRLASEWQTPAFRSPVFLTNGLLLTVTIESNGPASIDILNPATGTVQNRKLLAGIESGCTEAEISPDGSFVVTGHADGSLAVWETSTGRLLRSVTSEPFEDPDPLCAIDRIAISGNGRVVFTASFFRVQMKAWTLPELQPLGTAHLGATYPVHCAVSPDGGQIATSGVGQGLAINLWDKHLHGPQPRLSGQSDFLDAVAYAPDGRTIVAAGIDGQLKLWHLPTERELGTMLALPREVRFAHLAFSPEGSWLGVSDTAGNLHLFHAPIPAEN